ncbi:MAG: alpha-glucan family phosphorylase, partial [Desulfobacterales bacterium]|nr:alpha-glucan family phosphorylase [Desulfobacterales bacterium]
GYFRQLLDAGGWQQEEYPESEIFNLPLERARDQAGNEVTIAIDGPDGPIRAAVWKLMVGCIPLLLLDTNLPENPPDVREITTRLYVGELKLRLAQEVLLGIGGTRDLQAMGLFPAVSHRNEGHPAFASLERLAQIMDAFQVDLKTALEIVPRTTVFTTHTPVAAGHDEFPAAMIRPYIRPFAKRLGTDENQILAWGQPAGSTPDGPVSMFVMALRMAQYCNGVSELHGRVARRMWAHLWPRRNEKEVPISHVTNGIHIPSFISDEIALLFDRYLGPDWQRHTDTPELAGRINDIFDEELWRAHQMSRTRLIRTCRKLMVQQYARRNAPKAVMEEAEAVLDPDVLTIAFARRFATYKRATLLLQDPERLESILTSEKYPVQFIFAGKAHPRDNEGKDLIRRLVQFARRPKVRNKIIFIENYDIHIARMLVQGADVWLNTPRRPFEACGTSGMKAAVNGVLNLSILDGWWNEGYAEELGWRIGNGEEYIDASYQDGIESQALYNVLENDVLPCFYERKSGTLPARWLKMMKASIRNVLLKFCSHRMVEDYDRRFYVPAIGQLRQLTDNQAREAERLMRQREHIRSLWSDIRIDPPVKDPAGPFRVGEHMRITALAHLGELRPEEVVVQLYYGLLRSIDSLDTGATEPMEVVEQRDNGDFLFGCTIPCSVSGRFGFTVRIIPRGDDWLKAAPLMITWA